MCSKNKSNRNGNAFLITRRVVILFICILVTFNLCVFLKAVALFSHREDKNTVNEQDVTFSSTSNPDVEGIAACLLISDENSNLPEWLAYHYIIGPLRYLVVGVDTNSKTSPMEILNKWNTTTEMDIFMWDHEMKKTGKSEQDNEKVFVVRQRQFYQKCLKFHRRKQRKWTLFTDVDEYITFNPRVRFPKGTKVSKKIQEARMNLPRIVGEKSISQVLQDKENFPWAEKSCINVARLTFGNAEEEDESILNRGIPKGFDPKKFSTLRFFRYNYVVDDVHLSPGKSFVDISRISWESVSRDAAKRVHVIVPECDYIRGGTPKIIEEGLKIHHYSMSKEAFLARGGIYRDNKDYIVGRYERRANANGHISYDLQPWLTKFVEHFGYDKSQQLLKGVGELTVNPEPSEKHPAERKPVNTEHENHVTRQQFMSKHIKTALHRSSQREDF